MWRKALAVAAILCAGRAALAQVAVPEGVYLDKLQGMWLGELIGNYAGRAREGCWPEGGLYYQVNWADPAHIDLLSGGRDYVFRDAAWDGDDDTCFEYLYANVLLGNPNPTAAQVGQVWVDHIEYPSF